MQQAEAVKSCIDEFEAGHVVDITTQNEQDYLAGILSNVSSEDVWIGLTSTAKNNSLFWSDGSALNFTAWDMGGNGVRNEDEQCVRMRADSNYKWDDRSCNKYFGYVCEFQRK